MGVKGEELRERVRERYAGAARSVQGGAKGVVLRVDRRAWARLGSDWGGLDRGRLLVR